MDKDYYEKGSVKIAEVTAVQLKKLEQRRKLTKKSDRMVICLVGLPGRGKSFIARKLQTFLKWRGNECEVFNVGKYRRQVQADHVARTEAQKKEKPDIRSTLRQSVGACDANFFDSKNPKAAELRQEAASAAMVEMLKWLDVEKSVEDHSYDHIWASATKASIQRSRIAIFDATNSTAVRRQWVLEECTSPEKRNGKLTGCMFVESVCDDQELLEENFRFKVQNSPDFKGMTEDEAIADLRHRVQKYEEQYETIDDDSQSYIKIFNLSSKLLVNHIYGRMAKVIVPSLMSWNIGSRAIYLCRSGHTGKPSYDGTSPKSESQKNARGDLLGPQGLEFRDNLEKFIKKEGHAFAKRKSDAMMMPFAPLHKETGTSVSGLAGKDDHPFAAPSCAKERPFSCHIMTSTMPRAVQTATWEQLPFPIEEMPNLNPLDKGDFTGMELEEIKELHPAWYAMLEEDPFLTRFPGGECYGDLIHRLETCIIDMEQQVSMVCVVSHVSVLQVLISYFRRTPVDKCTSNEVPMNTVIKFTPVSGGGWTESQHRLISDGFSDVDVDQATEEETILKSSNRPLAIWGDRSTPSMSGSSMDETQSFF